MKLRNILERAYLLASNQKTDIQIHHLPQEIKGYKKRTMVQSQSIKTVEKEAIEKAIRESSTLTQASQILGIARSTLYRKIKEYELV